MEEREPRDRVPLAVESTISTGNGLISPLVRANLNNFMAGLVIEDPVLAERIAEFINHGCSEPSLVEKRAREIMGKNMLGLEEIIQHLQIHPRAISDLKDLSRAIPFSQTTLEICRDEFILVVDQGLSIREIAERINPGLLLSSINHSYPAEEFVTRKENAGWRLIRKDIVPGSDGKNYLGQKMLLGKAERVPTARELIHAIILYYLARGERLFRKITVRCADSTTSLRRVVIGPFIKEGGLAGGLSGGLLISDDWGDNAKVAGLGIAASRI